MSDDPIWNIPFSSGFFQQRFLACQVLVIRLQSILFLRNFIQRHLAC